MASELRVNTLKDASGNNSVAMSTVSGGSAKVWTNYGGSGTTFNDSFNASGAVDNGTGNYTISYTNSFSDANNAPQMSSTDVTEVGAEAQADITASSVKIRTHNSGGSVVDRDYVGLAGFGDLA